MSYAQKVYPQPLGTAGRFTIAQAGCFITSFCNLENRFLRDIDPPTLNTFLIRNNLYINGDNVGWGTISSYDPQTVVENIGTGNPPHNNSIVKFVYHGGASTHFSLVNDVNAGTIIDSWDGQIRSWDYYGGVKEWASYTNKGEQDMPTLTTAGNLEDLTLLATGRSSQGDPNLKNLIGQDLEETIRYFLKLPEHLKLLDRAAKDGSPESTVLKPGVYKVQ